MPRVNFYPASGPLTTDVTVAGIVTALAASGTLVYVVGAFTEVTDRNGTYTRNNAACIDTTSGLWTSWDPDCDTLITDVKVSGAHIYFVGQFTTVGGNAQAHIARVDTNGDLDLTWAPVSDLGPTCIEHISGVGVAIGLGFLGATVNGSSRIGIVMVDETTGTTTLPWEPGNGVTLLQGVIYQLATLGSKLYYTGKDWSTSSSIQQRGIGSVDIVTGLVDPFTRGWSFPGQVITVAKGVVWCGNGINTQTYTLPGNVFDGSTRPLFDLSSGDYGSWNPLTTPATSDSVFAIASDDDYVYVALKSPVTAVDGEPRVGLARFDASTGVLDSAFASTELEITLGSVPQCMTVANNGSVLVIGGAGLPGMTTLNGDTVSAYLLLINIATGQQL